MVVSNNTTMEILRVVLKHVSHDVFRRIINDLKQVEGNQSFKDTIIRMEKALDA